MLTSAQLKLSTLRAFLRRLFFEDTPAAKNYKGLAWLFLGVAGKENLLYDADWQQTLTKFPENFRLDYALSREAMTGGSESCDQHW